MASGAINASGAQTLTNNSTIQGNGQIGNSTTLSLINQGTVDATAVGGAVLYLNGTGGATVTNGTSSTAGVLEATGGGLLQISAPVANQYGSIVAAGTGSTVDVGSTIQGGTLTTSTGGVMQTLNVIASPATLDGSTAQGAITLSNGSTYTAVGTTDVLGTINLGTVTGSNIALSGTMMLTGATTLAGPGTVSMAAGTINASGPQTLTNQATIQGTGSIGNASGALTLNNQGTIDANVSGQTLQLGGSGGPVNNTGLMEATNSSTLGFVNTTITNAGSAYIAGGSAFTVTAASAPTYLQTSGTTRVDGTLTAGLTNVQGGLLDGTGTVAGNLQNAGTVMPGDSPGALATLTVTGNYTQAGGGNLVIAVTPPRASELLVGGSTTLAGKITFIYGPGTYVPATYTVISSVGPVNGTFGTVTEQGSVPTSLTRTVEYVPGSVPGPDVNLVLSSGVSVGGTVVAPADASIFSEQLASLTALADASAATLLNGGGSTNDCATAGVPPTPSESGAATTASSGIAAIGRMICNAGGWIHADGTFLGTDGGGGYPNYHADTAGFLAGVDRPVGGSGLRVGIAAGYDHRWLTDSAGGSATSDVARFGVYAIQPVGPVVLNAAFLYGHDWDASNRPTGVGTATAQYGGNEFSGGAQASLPLALGEVTVVPMGGVRFASVGTGSFVESASGSAAGFGVSGAGATQLSVIPYTRFVVSHDFSAASDITISPYAALGYQYQAGSSEKAVLLTASDGTTFSSGSASLDRSAGTLGAGVAVRHGSWMVYAAYGAQVAGNWQSQEISAGLRINF